MYITSADTLVYLKPCIQSGTRFCSSTGGTFSSDSNFSKLQTTMLYMCLTTHTVYPCGKLMWTFFSYLGTYLAGTEIPDKVVRQGGSPRQRVDALNARPIADVVIAVD